MKPGNWSMWLKSNSLVEKIIRTSELIEQALKEGRAGDARNELDMLRNSGFADYFSILIVAATADQKVESHELDREAYGTHPIHRQINCRF